MVLVDGETILQKLVSYEPRNHTHRTSQRVVDRLIERRVHPLMCELIRARVGKGWSREEWAEASGYSMSALCKWEAGHHIPRLRVLIDLAQALGYELKLVKT
jgi:ribosome-binding protein aMBF1 (putative translation factor)